MGRTRRIYTAKGCKKSQVFKPADFPHTIERTPSGTLYVRLPSGQLVNLEKLDKKGGGIKTYGKEVPSTFRIV